MKKRYAFTMIEILLVIVVIGVGLLSIVIAVSNAKISTNKTKQKVIATQLANEGIEMVYQIRNTNLLKHSNYKDYCRLDTNPTTICNDSSAYPSRITHKNYILLGQTLSGTTNELNIGDGIDISDQIFALCLTGGQRSSCPGSTNQTKYGKFFRTIKGKGLYLKNSSNTGGDLITCLNGNATSACHDNSAKEFRFCSKVEYIGTKTGSVEVCGVLTNFFD